MAGKLRLDKWLWQGRFFKTRTLAASRVQQDGVRINGVRVNKPATPVSPGDVLTFSQGTAVRVVRIEILGTRRGPAPEARELYSDLTPTRDEERNERPENPAFEGKGRPTKRDRRALDLSRARSLE
ncbi:RNA-binding S4 domain-containing protein [Sulfitobacter sp. D35]|uniref:RNA-binding S4 domain-containing protein n=1 Tax=Sulfitobacter sp. D35 TaxID=3083252 RepID=UPI00296F4B9D|nr:RNA-binding S4 domain-containing protein [Sulfitobacter sp. D35]MDW4496983.1 RNA-binding S4 domain-containing protein [Sulfitobacter sp. D35]